jgi:hypothetical protein
MTDPGLSDRLRQRSRRAGLMVGVSMALAIAICVGVFAGIYAGLTPWLSDLVPIAPAASTQVASNNAPAAPEPQSNDQPAIAPPDQAEPTPTPEPPSEPAPEPTSAPEPDGFEPTHQIVASGQSINLRPEPSTNNNPIRALSPATPLEFLDDESPSDEGTWLLFLTEQGEEGWVREIDTEPYQP